MLLLYIILYNFFLPISNSPQHRMVPASFQLQQVTWEAPDADTLWGWPPRGPAPDTIQTKFTLNASQQSHKKLNWTPSFTHRAKPSLLIFPVSERNKAASRYSKSVSLGLRVSESVTPPDTIGHYHIVYCVEEHHLTLSKTAIPWETEHWDPSVTCWGVSSSCIDTIKNVGNPWISVTGF